MKKSSRSTTITWAAVRRSVSGSRPLPRNASARVSVPWAGIAHHPRRRAVGTADQLEEGHDLGIVIQARARVATPQPVQQCRPQRVKRRLIRPPRPDDPGRCLWGDHADPGDRGRSRSRRPDAGQRAHAGRDSGPATLTRSPSRRPGSKPSWNSASPIWAYRCSGGTR